MNSKNMILKLAIRALFVSSRLFAAVAAGQNTVLYDNGNLSTGNRAESGELVCCGLTAWSELQHDIGNVAEANREEGFFEEQELARLADDFIIRPGNWWTIQSVNFFTKSFDGPAPVTAYSLRIWNGRPGDPGSAVVFGDAYSNRLTGCEFTHMSRVGNTVVPPPGLPTNDGFFGLIYRCSVEVSPLITLGPGTYWLDWDAKSFDAKFFGHTNPASAVRGLRGHADANARQYDVATGLWSNVVDPGDPQSAPDVPQDFPFKINGTLIAPGGLDPSFDGDGKVTTAMGSLSDRAHGVAFQPDGKILVAGSVQVGQGLDFGIVRYMPDGTLDPTFGNGGQIVTDISGRDSGNALAIQTDGKIVAAGRDEGDFAVVRYLAEGSLDPSFDGDGKVTTPIPTGSSGANAVAIQPDGKIVAAGSLYRGIFDTHFALVRYNVDGSLDTTFDGDGIVTTSWFSGFANAMIIQPDGRIVVAGGTESLVGTAFVLARYDPNGGLDTSFDGDGTVFTAFGGEDTAGSAEAVALDLSGNIVAAGNYAISEKDRGFALTRYNSGGSPDLSLGSDGIVKTPFSTENASAYGIGIQPNGRIVAAGGSRSFSNTDDFDFIVARYKTDGSLDTSFDDDGKVTTNFFNLNDVAEAVSIQADGRIVAAGSAFTGTGNYDFAVARYIADAAVWHGPLFDFDGDGMTDLSVFRPSNATWYLQRSQAGFFGAQFGISTDKIVPADYDRDGNTDIAVYRPSEGTWYVINSSNSTFSYRRYGLADDLPTPADYDGDARADLSVFRPSNGTWYRQNSFDGTSTAIQFGTNGDKPTLGDFDGDGKADVGVFRPSNGTWYRLNSANGAFFGQQFGTSTDLTVPADYDGDGRTDIGVYRAGEGNWYLDRSTLGFTAVSFGAAADIATPGDFDGDGRADISVFRPSDGNWYRLNSSNGGFSAIQFGTNGDKPTPAAFRY